MVSQFKGYYDYEISEINKIQKTITYSVLLMYDNMWVCQSEMLSWHIFIVRKNDSKFTQKMFE